MKWHQNGQEAVNHNELTIKGFHFNRDVGEESFF